MQKEYLNTVDTILNQLGINYRKHPCRNSALYFCKMPVNGLTFDLEYNENGTVQMWRFVGTAPVSKAGMKYEYHTPEYPDSAIGLEVTEEGDVRFYLRQKVNKNDPDRVIFITSMIMDYIRRIINRDSTA